MTELTLFHNHYQCTGEKSAGDMVLLHGWGMHSLVWDDIMPHLLQHFDVMVIDLPGMGQSPLPACDYTVDSLLQQILACAPDKAIYIGWSLGGLLASCIAARFPARVNALITIACNLSFTQRRDWPWAMDGKIFAQFQAMYEEDAEGTQIRFLALNCKGSQSQRDDTRKLREIMNFCGLPARKALREGLVILAQTDLREELGKLRAPSLHIFGEHDNLVPLQAVGEIEAAYQQAGLQTTTAIIAGCAHVPFISAPETCYQAMQPLLQRFIV